MTQRGRQSNSEFDPRQGQPSPPPAAPIDDPWATPEPGTKPQTKPHYGYHPKGYGTPHTPQLNGYETNGHEANGYETNYGTHNYGAANHRTNGHGTNGHGTNGHGSNGYGSNTYSANGTSANGTSTNGYRSGHGANQGRPASNHSGQNNYGQNNYGQNNYGQNGHSVGSNQGQPQPYNTNHQPIRRPATGYSANGYTGGNAGGQPNGRYGVPSQAAAYASHQQFSYGPDEADEFDDDNWATDDEYGDEYGDETAEQNPSRYNPAAYRVQADVNESNSQTFFRAFLPSLGFLKRWQFWGVVGLVMTTGLAGVSAAYLLRLPGLPNCPAIFLPTASASLRLYCAQVAADKRTIDDLLAAIALVEDLPEDHPMRQEIDHHLELWSVDILELADESFHNGDLETAIATAKRIPAQTSSAKLVDERIQRWKTIWAEAESIYKQAEDALREGNFREAFARSVELLEVGNNYWATTRYQELTNNITSARRDGAKLVEARSKARRNTADSILEAIEIAKAIKPESYVYAEAQKAIDEFIERMYILAIDTLDQGYSNDAISIANKIPAEGDMKTKVRDFLILARAVRQAGEGQQDDLQRAILEAQQLTASSALYSKAQQLISRWELQIQDLARLNWARQLATPGTLGDLTAAISEAQLIPRSNPLWDEAQAEIAKWTRQVEIIEDRPYLERAELLAANGDINSLKSAIAEASNIRSGRSLYDEAQTKIRGWRQRVETAEDQPILDEAKMLARSGNIDAAIATAERITSGRALYDDAQDEIRRWRNQVRGQQALQDAYRAASIGTVNGLADAIRMADQVPAGSSSRSEADQMRNVWSQELLRQANAESISDPESAIAIAKRIPSGTSAYGSAQQLIQSLESQLAPVELDPFDDADSPIPPDSEFGTTNSR